METLDISLFSACIVSNHSDEHYQYWCLFVDACRILCQLHITSDEMEKAHICIVDYCKKFEEVCGKEYCTPNMHMACHLQSNVLD